MCAEAAVREEPTTSRSVTEETALPSLAKEEVKAAGPATALVAVPVAAPVATPEVAARQRHAQTVFRDLFAEELRAGGGDATEAAAAALRRLASHRSQA